MDTELNIPLIHITNYAKNSFFFRGWLLSIYLHRKIKNHLFLDISDLQQSQFVKHD